MGEELKNLCLHQDVIIQYKTNTQRQVHIGISKKKEDAIPKREKNIINNNEKEDVKKQINYEQIE